MSQDTEVKTTPEAQVAAYRQWEPDEKISSPASARATFKVRNSSDAAGKYTLKIGNGSTETHNIRKGEKQEYDVVNQAVVGVNKGKVDLEWDRT